MIGQPEAAQPLTVQEATPAERLAWDSFVDGEGGSFFHYYDWKQVYDARGDQFIPIVVKAAPSQLIGILPVVKHGRQPCSTLRSLPEGASGGYLLRRGLPDEARHEAVTALLRFVDARYSRGCATFTLHENLTLTGQRCEDPTKALVDGGFRFIYDRSTRLPCTHIIELGRPFEQVWSGWPGNFRRAIARTSRTGVVVVDDRELRYARSFADMLRDNFRRHKSRPPTVDEVMVHLSVFRDRSRLFVALLDGSPIVAMLCHYTPSTCYLAKIGSHEMDTDNANRLCWKAAIEDACNRGYRYVECGMTATPGVAFFKDRFQGTRVPMRIYEKRYSLPGALMQKVPELIREVRRDKAFIWKNRRTIWDRVVHL